jgi:hypothetical protein
MRYLTQLIQLPTPTDRTGRNHQRVHECIRMEGRVARPRERTATRTREAALDPCERHWAFDAMTAPVRRATVALAERRTAASAIAIDPKALEMIAALNTAYDLAVGERFDIEIAMPEWATIAPHSAHDLTLSADRALALLTALPLPDQRDGVSVRRLHIAALAVIAGKPEAFVAWRTRHTDAGHMPPAPTLNLVWEALLVEQRLQHADAVREQVAHLREELTVAPARTAGLDLAMRNFAQLNLVTAAGDLLTYRLRGAPTNLLGRLALLMQDARRGTPGDREMRSLLVWLTYAVAAVVAPLNDQLLLPSV